MKLLSNIGNFFLKSKMRIAGLVVVVLLVLAYVVTINNTKQTTRESKVGTPTPTRALSPQEQQSLGQAKTSFIAKLPIDTEQYLIEYFPDRDYFFVQIRKNPYNQYKAQVENLFRQNGLDPSRVTIEWGSVRGVAP